MLTSFQISAIPDREGMSVGSCCPVLGLLSLFTLLLDPRIAESTGDSSCVKENTLSRQRGRCCGSLTETHTLAPVLHSPRDTVRKEPVGLSKISDQRSPKVVL